MTAQSFSGRLLAGPTRVWVACTVAALAALPVAAEVTVFRNAVLHPVAGPPLEAASLVVEGGKIVALGQNVATPPDARVVDLGGAHVYPGFVHANTTLGLVDVSTVKGSVDLREIGENNADLRSEVAFHADSVQLPVALRGGVTAAHVVVHGELFAGQSAVMRLEGWNYEDMTVRAGIGQHLFFPAMPPAGEGEGVEEAKKKRDEALKKLTDLLADARAYQVAQRAQSPGLDRNAKLEGLLPVLDGQQPLFLHADERRQIAGALDWAKEQGIAKVVLVAGADVAALASRLAAEKIPVILRGVLELPERNWEPYDTAYTAAARLHQAGVSFALADGDDGQGEDSALARNLIFHAAMAVAFGLPEDVALRSVTLSAAEILGVADRVGSLEVGKDATFLVIRGNPFDIRQAFERIFVAGHEVDLTNEHQYRLYQKYQARPKPTLASPR